MKALIGVLLLVPVPQVLDHGGKSKSALKRSPAKRRPVLKVSEARTAKERLAALVLERDRLNGLVIITETAKVDEEKRIANERAAEQGRHDSLRFQSCPVGHVEVVNFGIGNKKHLLVLRSYGYTICDE